MTDTAEMLEITNLSPAIEVVHLSTLPEEEQCEIVDILFARPGNGAVT